MKNQKGFTLVELMVVLAIIAILATSGISQYGKFIKSARDTTRVADMGALNIVILDSIQSTGVVPTNIAALKTQITSVAGKKIIDKLNGTAACLDGTKVATNCGYKYATCDGKTGYIIATNFETPDNVSKYTKDDVSTTATDPTTVMNANMYEIGSCNAIDADAPLTAIYDAAGA